MAYVKAKVGKRDEPSSGAETHSCALAPTLRYDFSMRSFYEVLSGSIRT